MTDIALERETANDESAVVVAIHAVSGAIVATDELLFEIENSKAAQEVRAPHAGLLTHALEIGQNVAFGVKIADLAAQGAQPCPAPIERTPATAPKTPYAPTVAAPAASLPPREPRFSHAAAELIARHNLAATQFTTDFVTTRDIEALIALDAPSPRPAPAPPAIKPTVSPAPKGGQPVNPRKRTEIEVLSGGAGAGMLSVLGVTIGPLTIKRGPDDFLAGRITDLVIYEAARLMRKYPKLNAAYQDGHVVLHDAIHAGLAIDSGARLVVYGIAHADELPFLELSATIVDAAARYVNDELTAAEMSRATFTVTDLSADELDFVLPLLPRGQSCILGITQSGHAGFRIFAGFDHRVTEGREIAIFLGELRNRLLSFATAAPYDIETICCAYCARTLSEAVQKSRDKGLLKIVGRDGREALCCESCWNGW